MMKNLKREMTWRNFYEVTLMAVIITSNNKVKGDVAHP